MSKLSLCLPQFSDCISVRMHKVSFGHANQCPKNNGYEFENEDYSFKRIIFNVVFFQIKINNSLILSLMCVFCGKQNIYIITTITGLRFFNCSNYGGYKRLNFLLGFRK